MEDEKRVYVLNAEEVNLEGLHVNKLTNEEFKARAEKEGKSYSLKLFEEAFNYELVNTRTDYIRII